MNPMITPDVVAAEVAYRYERDHIGTTPSVPRRTRIGLRRRLRAHLPAPRTARTRRA